MTLNYILIHLEHTHSYQSISLSIYLYIYSRNQHILRMLFVQILFFKPAAFVPHLTDKRDWLLAHGMGVSNIGLDDL